MALIVADVAEDNADDEEPEESALLDEVIAIVLVSSNWLSLLCLSTLERSKRI